MDTEDELFEYDEEEAVKFIHDRLPQELKKKFTTDDIYYILDVICDFYDANDYLDEDDEEKEEQELIQFIIQQAKKDEVGSFLPDDIAIILEAEAAYSDTFDF